MNFQKYVGKEFFKKLCVLSLLVGVTASWYTFTYQLFQKIQDQSVIVYVDDQKKQIYAPDWEIDDVLQKADVSLGELDRVQITKQTGKPMEIAVFRNMIDPKPVRMTVATSRGEMTYRAVYQMEATAYLPGDGDGRGITATGIPATHGVVAVDPKVIPLGSRVFIPGYGFAIAADTGGAIRGEKIDLCMESYSEAMQFGRRGVTVYLF